MATVTILRSKAKDRDRDRRRRHPKAALVAAGGRKAPRVVFPFAPDLTTDGHARRWDQFDRVHRQPVLGDRGANLEVLTFEALFADENPQRSTERELKALEKMAKQGVRVRIRNLPGAGLWYRITALTITDELRQHGTNRRTRALVRFTLTEDSRSHRNVGPTSRGKGSK